MFTPSLLSAATALSLLAASADAAYTNFSTVTGYFLQDDASTVASGFDYTSTNFGLKDQVYDTDATFSPGGTKSQWERFENKVAALNAASPAGTQYKVLYLGRHGEGYHNVAETYYGTPAWNCYWSELDGNGTSVWADAQITPNGYNQAVIAHNFWVSQMANQKQSLPASFYSSPMSRCLSTASITFGDLTPTTFSPIVKEYFREGISQHTCDRRSNKTYIATTYPNYRFEAGFTEKDELWRGVDAETSAAQDIRSKYALDAVFASDSSRFISVTSHSGETASMLRVLGHRTFSLATGAVLPVLVKAVVLADAPATTSIVSWSGLATCTVPPITSLAASGCICPSATSTSTLTTQTSPASSSATVTGTSSVVTGTPSFTGNATVSATGSTAQMTTSTVFTTKVSTITSCAPTVTNCPVGSVTTVIVALYTTVCPVADATPVASVSFSTYTVHTTKVSTVTACPATVTNCPIGSVTTVTIPLYTMTTAVTIVASSPVSGAGSSTKSASKTTTPAASNPVVSTSKTSSPSTTPTSSVAIGAAAAVVPGFVSVIGAAVAIFLL